MGGFFGTVSMAECVTDLFYGTDYNSHLGTKRAGMATYSEGEGFVRSIHSLESSYFRTKFESELPKLYPEDEKMPVEDRLLKDWSIFSGSPFEVKQIVSEYVSEALDLESRITMERVGIPQLFDETYLIYNSIMGKYSWDVFKKYLRN